MINLLVMILAIYVLAIVTDEFFIKSLDQISAKLKLPSSVAGATLMAAGSSSPELAIALLSLFTAGGEHSDLGAGTIVGSAVFNILVITGASAVFAGRTRITWWVVVRDCVVYVVTILLLLNALEDGRVTPLETLLFLGVYGIYIGILFQWSKFVREGDPDPLSDDPPLAEPSPPVTQGVSFKPILLFFKQASRFIGRGIGLFAGDPVTAYMRAFFVSIGFVAVISYILVENAVAFADALQIPPVVVALTILAGGTSVPDMIASVIVARQGRGDMAISNAVGSNIFNILVGLGLPWLIALSMGRMVQVATDDLWLSTIILLGTVLILFIFLTTNRTLSRLEGWILLAIYVAYAVWTYWSVLA
jgi:K+-dependent Na+/Ca+ exchanger-like protein